MNPALAVPSALKLHTSITSVLLVGSRADDRATELSDWDFVVETNNFPAVARELPRLVASLSPIAQQWDRLSETACYMLTLAGPVKVDLIFANVPHAPESPWEISPDTLPGLDAHFWDWILWLTSKQAYGRQELVSAELAKMWGHLLHPLGVAERPGTLDEATESYLAARCQWEQRLRLSVPRDLEREILPRLRHRSKTNSGGCAGGR